MNDYLFNFPFPPYKIQEDLMKKIYDTIQNEEFGIFSSPTGTGKSLSIICSVFSWLENYKKEKRELVKNNLEILNKKLIDLENDKNEDWIGLHKIKTELDNEKIEWTIFDKKFSKFDLKNEELKNRKQIYIKKTPFSLTKKKKIEEEDIEEKESKTNLNSDENLIDFNSEESDLESDIEVNEEDDLYVKPKIIYCSRTHSQLSQFINEIQKTVFKDKIRFLTLGSRLNLCVNPEVNKSKSLNVINDKCLDLQRKSKQSCQYKKVNQLKNLKDEFLSTIMDIEDAFEAGQQLKCCPYYSERLAIDEAEVLIVPYNILLHENTRDSYNIKLEDSIIIIDEAHNLLDTISSIYSSEINCGQLIDCLSQLNQYQLRYNTRLNAKNMMHIKQLIMLINALIKFLQSLEESKVLTVVDLDINCGIENLNLFNLIDFSEKTQLPRKLMGFIQSKSFSSNNTENTIVQKNSLQGTLSFLERMKNQQKPEKNKKKSAKKEEIKKVEIKKEENAKTQVTEPDKPISYLYQIIDFMKALTNSSEDGRVLINIDKSSQKKSSYKFVLLNPAKSFEKITRKARSIILAGGTMEPVDQFTNSIFSKKFCSKKITNFACDHVIPDKNLFVCALTSGSSKVKFDFSYQQRTNKKIFNELGDLLINVCEIIKGGIVVFFVSYNFEEQIYNYFKNNKFIEKFEKKGKKIFREPRTSMDVNKVLSDYSNTIAMSLNKNNSSCTGSILFSVVGGKMSEGINFNDDLGRCVIMVGLPYANIKSIELQQKLNYIESQYENINEGKRASNDYYENLCMKAVNQSIGRAIRHQKDYASILLVDYRYSTKISIVEALPNWIKKCYQSETDFQKCFESLKSFFINKEKF